jgi:hypothetical protein
MTKLKGEKVECDVCNKIIDTERFRVVMVFKADYKERYLHESCSDCEKDLDVCDDCIKDLNFKPFEK